jgi:hypothetical protein
VQQKVHCEKYEERKNSGKLSTLQILCKVRRFFLYFTHPPYVMGRIEFPSTPINAGQHKQESNEPLFSQPTLEGTEFDPGPEIELGYCIISTQPNYKKRKKGNEWHSGINMQPDLLHPDQEGEFEVHATAGILSCTVN